MNRKKLFESRVYFAGMVRVAMLFGMAVGCASLHQVSTVSKTKIDKVLLLVGLKVKRTAPEFACDSYLSYFAKNFQDPAFTETLACLNSIKEGSATYSYQLNDSQNPEPFLQWKESTKGAAECTKKILPVMRVPRELYFVAQGMARDEIKDTWECYAVNLNSEAGVIADIKLPWDRFKLELKFPLSRELKTKADLQIWFMTTLLESIKSEMGGELQASMVTENLCQQCYRDTPWFDEKRKDKIPPVYWKNTP